MAQKHEIRILLAGLEKIQASLEGNRRILESIRAGLDAPPPSDYFGEYWNKLKSCADEFSRWRRSFAANSGPLGDGIAHHFNQHRMCGFLEPPEILPRQIETALVRFDQPPRLRTFDRYAGPWAGDTRIYFPAPNGGYAENKLPVTYSIWGKQQRQGGLTYQKITASNVGYVDPDDLPNMGYGHTDLLYNAYTKKLGIVNWSNLIRTSSQTRAIGYEVNSHLLWLNQFLTPELTPVRRRDNLDFLVTLEYLANDGPLTLFCIYGVVLVFDCAAGTVEFGGRILQMRNALVVR